jgi:hypothetical protein
MNENQRHLVGLGRNLEIDDSMVGMIALSLFNGGAPVDKATVVIFSGTM